MAASHVQVAPDSTGKDVDADSLTSSEAGTPTVYRQNMVIADPTTYANKAIVDSLGRQVHKRGVDTSDKVSVVLSVSAVASVTAETGLTLNQSRAAAATSVTTYTVPAGKSFRVTSVRFGTGFATMSTTVTFANVTFRVRVVSSGTATATSGILLQDRLNAAANTPTPDTEINVPEGIDLTAGNSLIITQQASATTLVNDVQLVGFEYTP